MTPAANVRYPAAHRQPAWELHLHCRLAEAWAADGDLSKAQGHLQAATALAADHADADTQASQALAPMHACMSVKSKMRWGHSTVSKRS